MTALAGAGTGGDLVPLRRLVSGIIPVMGALLFFHRPD